MTDAFWEVLAQDAYEFWAKNYPDLAPWEKINQRSRDNFKAMVLHVAKRLVERGKAALR